MTSILEEIETRAILLDHALLQRNISAAADRAAAHGLRLRPHVKSHKSTAIAGIQIAADAYGITVAKNSEVDPFIRSGIGDITVAYPLIERRKLTRLQTLAKEHGTKLNLIADSPIGLAAIAEAKRSSCPGVRRAGERSTACNDDDRRSCGQRLGERRLAEIKGDVYIRVPVYRKILPTKCVQRSGERKHAATDDEDVGAHRVEDARGRIVCGRVAGKDLDTRNVFRQLLKRAPAGGQPQRFCRKLLARSQKRLWLDTLIQRVQRIVEMPIGNWLEIAACGSCEPPRCHPMLLTQTGKI